VLAFLAGYGLSCDANHMTGPDREGRGAAAAMRAALRDAGAEQVDFVSLHGTGTRFNDLMEARALLALLGEKAAEVPVNSIKGAIGHTLGAAAALEAIMAVRALGEQRIPPTCGLLVQDPEIPLLVVRDRPLGRPLATVLSTASGFGGLNAAVVLTRGDP
jgi:3-oxoacyl-[acyl-carrier-protein] synthase II